MRLLAVYQANYFDDKLMTFLRRKSDIVSSGQKLLAQTFPNQCYNAQNFNLTAGDEKSARAQTLSGFAEERRFSSGEMN
jgi:hypothetical protein